MSGVDDLVAQMRASPKGMRFADLERICRTFFGERRRSSGSHQTYKMPWPGDPRVNIQDFRGEAKPHQARQVLAAIDRLKKEKT